MCGRRRACFVFVCLPDDVEQLLGVDVSNIIHVFANSECPICKGPKCFSNSFCWKCIIKTEIELGVDDVYSDDSYGSSVIITLHDKDEMERKKRKYVPTCNVREPL